MNIRQLIKNSKSPYIKLLRVCYYGMRRFSMPAPRILWNPIWFVVNFIRNMYWWFIQIFFVTPMYKGLCEKVGDNFSAGTYLPYLVGKGLIIIGDNVTFHGKQDFIFGSIKEEIPEIHIGDDTTVGHNVTFDVAGKLIIGEHCLIARNTTFQDCSGHSLDAVDRGKGVPPSAKDVRPITIGNNVWVGTGAYILPGTVIGDDCVISAYTTVGRTIPPNHLVYGAPSKVIKIRKISKIYDKQMIYSD